MAEPEELPPLGIVMDGSFGLGIDELLALTVLHAASHVQDAAVSLAAVNVTYPSLAAAQLVDSLGWLYADHASRNFPERFRRGWSRLPVGLLDSGAAEPPPATAAALARNNAGGEPLYRTEIKDLNDTGISAALIRNALTAQHQQNALILLTGPATALLKMLSLNQTLDLAADKVRTLVVGGEIERDLPTARQLLAKWPTPIVALDPSSDSAVRFQLETLADGFAWTPDHPLVDAYAALADQTSSSTPATLAAFYSVRPDASYWNLSEPGRLHLLDDGSLELAPDPAGAHRLVRVADGSSDTLLEELTALVQAEPAERPLPGFLKRLIEQEKAKELEEQQKQADPPAEAPKPR